ncbi:MAG: phenylalanine--tRNA ligase subunit beta [Desulfovibrionaceae bacterium]
MLVSLRWLQEFVPYTGTVSELCTVLTCLGLEVESVTKPFDFLSSIVVGKVLTCERHPKSEKLSVCTVDVGSTILRIVCGAGNISSSLFVPVARVGTVMPNGLLIKEVSLRGEISEGMICSEEELRLAFSSEGILSLREDSVIGMTLLEHFSLDDTIIELNITPNRADCLSIFGVAREIALAFSLPLSFPENSFYVTKGYCEEYSFIVEESSLVSFYSVRVLEDIVIADSPSWMRYRLLSVGIRPISNIVDITNYVLVEFGQPLHAFDANAIVGSSIRVGTAEEGSVFTALDSSKYTLSSEDICIFDEKKVIALAGIMGGKNTEVSSKTTKILLESAVFSPHSVRKTARRLSLHSNASYRFERGVDRMQSKFAMERAIHLLSSIMSLSISSVCLEIEETRVVPAILFRASKARELLGLLVADGFCRDILLSLGCIIEEADFFWKVSPPSYRMDLTEEVDLIEEIARLYGVDRIEGSLPTVKKNIALDSTSDEYYSLRRVKNWAANLGLREIISYSFTSQESLDILGVPSENRVILQNPLSLEYTTMRTTLLPAMLKTMQYNNNRGNTSLAFFEIAKTFTQDLEKETQSNEKDMLCIALHGNKNPREWFSQHEMWDYLDIKGIVEHCCSVFFDENCSYDILEEHSYLSPAVSIFSGKEKIGIMGRVLPDIAKKYDNKEDIWCAEISLSQFLQNEKSEVKSISSVPQYPSIKRDITFIIPEDGIYVGILFDVISDMSLSLLEDFFLIGIYYPKETNEKHVTVRFVFRDSQSTLTDELADSLRKDISDHIMRILSVRV